MFRFTENQKGGEMSNWIKTIERAIVDIYIESSGERWCNYKLVNDQTGHHFIPVSSGLCYVTNATHWMYAPEKPE
mgnify:FL=1